MTEQLILLDLFYYFAATALFVPFFNHFGLGSVLGYLSAGIVLGPHALGLLHHVQNIQEISHIGIIMLMFVIGLELTPLRISHLKKTILIEGTLQFVVSTSLLSLPLKFMGFNWPVSLLLGAALSLSSTAFSLTWLKDNDHLTKSHGQSSIGILIFQDLIIIPLLMIIPLVGAQTGGVQFEASTIAINTSILAGLFVMSRYVFIPVLDKIYSSQGKEVFIGSCLMFLLGSAILMGHLGLSKALGALIAGIFLSSSRLKSDIQSFTLPIKTMMMGVFFMGFGLGFDLSFFQNNFAQILLCTLGLLAIKATVLLGIGKTTGKSWQGAISLAFILCQGGEFGLLAIASLEGHSLVDEFFGQLIMSSITLSIFLGTFLAKCITLMEARKKAAAIVTEEKEEISAQPEQPEQNDDKNIESLESYRDKNKKVNYKDKKVKEKAA